MTKTDEDRIKELSADHISRMYEDTMRGYSKPTTFWGKVFKNNPFYRTWVLWKELQ